MRGAQFRRYTGWAGTASPDTVLIQRGGAMAGYAQSGWISAGFEKPALLVKSVQVSAHGQLAEWSIVAVLKLMGYWRGVVNYPSTPP